jgi:hypothetical protein
MQQPRRRFRPKEAPKLRPRLAADLDGQHGQVEMPHFIEAKVITLRQILNGYLPSAGVISNSNILS